jgi:hypothetical protein
LNELSPKQGSAPPLQSPSAEAPSVLPEAEPEPSRHPRLALLLGLYQLAIGAAAAGALVATLFLWPTPDPSVAPLDMPSRLAAEPMVKLLAAMMAGGALGAVLLNLVGLHVHAAHANDFAPRFTGSYLLGPLAAVLLALALFVVVQGGMMVLGGDPAPSAAAELRRATLFHGALGFLVGMAFDTVVLRLDGVARQIFGDDRGSLLARSVQRVRGRREQTAEAAEVGNGGSAPPPANDPTATRERSTDGRERKPAAPFGAGRGP